MNANDTGKSRIIVRSEEEMITQVKLLLNNGYAVAVNKEINVLSTEDSGSYRLIYKKVKQT